MTHTRCGSNERVPGLPTPRAQARRQNLNNPIAHIRRKGKGSTRPQGNVWVATCVRVFVFLKQNFPHGGWVRIRLLQDIARCESSRKSCSRGKYLPGTFLEKTRKPHTTHEGVCTMASFFFLPPLCCVRPACRPAVS